METFYSRAEAVPEADDHVTQLGDEPLGSQHLRDYRTQLGATRKVLEPMYSHHTLYSSQLEHYPFLRNHCKLLPSSLSPRPPAPAPISFVMAASIMVTFVSIVVLNKYTLNEQ